MKHWGMGEGRGFKTYGWAAQALVVAPGAERVEVEEVEVIEEELDWAAARVKPAAKRKVVSCMVYGRESL